MLRNKMGDSDEEIERRQRGRDKFMKERTDYNDRQRRDFIDRRSFQQRDYRSGPQSYQQRRPEMSPPMKKRRPEGDELSDRVQEPVQPKRDERDSTGSAVPLMMTFKQFLATQDDSINDDEAVLKYQEYKIEFKRQQLHSFFVAHKEEEWFRLKYHPEDSAKRRTEQQDATKKRMEVFMYLLDKGWVDKAHLDQDNIKNIIKLLDGVVVKLEDGTDEDLETLLQIPIDDLEEQLELENLEKKDEKNGHENGETDSQTHAAKKRKRKSGSRGSALSDEEGAVSDSESDSGVSESEKSESKKSSKVSESEAKPEPSTLDESHEDKKGTFLLHRTASIFFRNIAPAIPKHEVEALCKKFPGYLRLTLAEPIPERCFYRRGWCTFKRDVNIKDIWWNLSNARISHKHPAGMRECELGAIVNRDLTRKTRAVNGITAHKQIAKADLKHAAKLIQIYDRRANLWIDETEKEQPNDSNMLAASKNPLLNNITDFLVEELSAEEEELLGQNDKAEDGASVPKVAFNRDDNILKVLDRLLLYLRIVHSFDYYNHGEYPSEDEMPNRCGVMHIRGPPPSPSYGHNELGTNPETGKETVLVSVSFVDEMMRTFEMRLEPFLTPKERISDDEAEKLGRKDPEKEVEAFINANCLELAKEKWLCPLSGKKFKGPDFVRKHILSKHVDKVEEVRQEVGYFNNYVYDPKRPVLVDVLRPTGPADDSRPPQRYYNRPQYPPREGGESREGDSRDRHYASDRLHGGGYHYPQYSRGRGYQNRDRYNYQNRQDNFGGGRYHRGMGNERRLIEYRDLDAPSDDPY